MDKNSAVNNSKQSDRRSNGDKGEQPEAADNSVRIPPKCTRCGMEFKHKVSLVLHILRHSKQKRFPCQVCKKQISPNNILKHMTLHRGRKKTTLTKVDNSADEENKDKKPISGAELGRLSKPTLGRKAAKAGSGGSTFQQSKYKPKQILYNRYLEKTLLHAGAASAAATTEDAPTSATTKVTATVAAEAATAAAEAAKAAAEAATAAAEAAAAAAAAAKTAAAAAVYK